MENIVSSAPLGEGIGLEVAFVCAGRMVDAVAEAQLLVQLEVEDVETSCLLIFKVVTTHPAGIHTPKPTLTQQARRGRGLPILVGNLGTGPPFVRDIC